MVAIAASIPWLVPALVVALLAATLLAPWLAGRLRSGPPGAWLLLASVGLILSATLTPGHGPPVEPGTCDLGRLGPLPFRGIRPVTEAGLNVVLFVPLGVAIAVLPPVAPRGLLLVLAAAAPFAIELLQSLLVPLGRGCQAGDVVDNLMGLAIGVVLAAPARALLDRLRRRAGA